MTNILFVNTDENVANMMKNAFMQKENEVEVTRLDMNSFKSYEDFIPDLTIIDFNNFGLIVVS